MKKFLNIAFLLLFITIIYYIFFADESSKSVANDDQITLIFDDTEFFPQKTNDELKTLLIRAGIPLGESNRYLIQGTPDFQNHIITFYLPKGSIRPQHKDYIIQYLKNIRENDATQPNTFQSTNKNTPFAHLIGYQFNIASMGNN